MQQTRSDVPRFQMAQKLVARFFQALFSVDRLSGVHTGGVQREYWISKFGNIGHLVTRFFNSWMPWFGLFHWLGIITFASVIPTSPKLHWQLLRPLHKPDLWSNRSNKVASLSDHMVLNSIVEFNRSSIEQWNGRISLSFIKTSFTFNIFETVMIAL